MHLQRAIEEFGLSAHEAKLYLAALVHGEATLSDLARTAKLPRTSCYGAVRALEKWELRKIVCLLGFFLFSSALREK